MAATKTASRQVPALDIVPTNNSTNGVESNGVFDALALKAPLSRPIVPKTSNYQILANESGTIFTNGSGLSTVEFTLPASAGCTAGVTNYTFIRTSSNADLMFVTAGTDVVNDGSAGYITSIPYDALSLTFFGTLNGSPTWVITNKTDGWMDL